MAKTDLQKFAHPAYLDMMGEYKAIRDCYKGAKAVKEAGEVYLPRLTGQSQPDYDNYKRRALFFPITGKTASTMVGLATTKPPKTTYPEIMKPYFIDSEYGFQFTEFYVKTFTEVTLMGRYGVLIDAPKDQVGDPILSTYLAENIIRWDNEEGPMKSLLLREYIYEKEENEKFRMELECRYRHCFIDVDGVYKVEVLDDELQTIEGPIAPIFSGHTIDFIPFTPFGSSGVHMSIDKPPMQDIASINISHYMSSADLEWGRHITGLPTPVVSGVDSSTVLHIGGTRAWILPVVEAKAYYMEFLGQGLQSLEKALTEKIGLMASVSARLIDNSTRGSEAAETVRLRYMSESASLIHIINSVETGLIMMYNMLSKLMKANDQVTILFSREVIGLGIAFKDLKVLFDAYFQGGISKAALLYNLRRLEAVDPNSKDSDELAAIRDPDPIKPPTATTTQTTTE